MKQILLFLIIQFIQKKMNKISYFLNLIQRFQNLNQNIIYLEEQNFLILRPGINAIKFIRGFDII